MVGEQRRVLWEKMIRRCIELAIEAASAGNYALGALVARSSEILSESGSTLILNGDDPSAHPEMVAVRASAKLLGSRHLPGTTLFSTLEPCPMCVSVAIWAKMDGVVFGASQEDARQWVAKHPSDIYSWRMIDIPAAAIASAGVPRLWVHGGILREECVALFERSR